LIDYVPIIQKISSYAFAKKKIELSVLRLDLLHPQIGGNKWFKLKYNLAAAKKQKLDTILTFGGAFSNHIHATAAACRLSGFKSIGIIRGEEQSETNTTLSSAKEWGMKLHFVSREEYEKKHTEEFIKALENKYGNFYLIPEGGNNYSGALGCSEILESITDFDSVFCACGTATTFAGLSKKLLPWKKLIGISILKGEQSTIKETQELINKIRQDRHFEIFGNDEVLNKTPIQRSGIVNDYNFGGYAKHTKALLEFKNMFEKNYAIPLDYVYTSKLFYAVFDLISKNKIEENSKILMIHSGGLQGNKGYEKRHAL
jgi:1-aminocyclopropane-1-carboxylate deaminase